MRRSSEVTESLRLALQATLDDQKTQAERNCLGQFATPTALAEDILRYAATLLPQGARIRFLDPAIGTGSFYSALRKVFPGKHIADAVGYEIDPHYAEPATDLWRDTGLALRLGDFTTAAPESRFNLVICNPPYVRHHHLKESEKSRLQFRTKQASGMNISGLAGLYCHFVGLSHAWMAADGIAGWLIPSEFMDVNYGQAVKRYLLDRVTLLHIHRFDPNEVQFADALVSSAVVWFRNAPAPDDHKVKFTFGGTLDAPTTSRLVSTRDLAHESKWTRFPVSEVRNQFGNATLSDLFRIKRGIATGDNSYFILSEEEIASSKLPFEVFTPILPSPRYLLRDEVKPRADGSPDIERRLFLLDTRLPEDEIRKRFPSLFVYLEEGRKRNLHQRYLCSHRTPWYSQEHRPPAPIVCTYIGRGDAKSGRPFRFIRNESRATVANVYLAMYPTADLAREIDKDRTLIDRLWQKLNGLDVTDLLGQGRVYGGGLHKLEPRELGSVDIKCLLDLLPQFLVLKKRASQLDLFDSRTKSPVRNILQRTLV